MGLGRCLPKSDTNPLTKAKHLYYIAHQARLPRSALIRKGHRSPMSRTGLHRPRHTRAVWDRPATDTRLFPYPFPPNIPLHFPHYKRCPKAHRLRLRSDQSMSLPVYVTRHGRFPDKKRLALSKGQCQVRAALTRHNTLAPSGDAHEHGVKLLPRAIVPRDSAVAASGEAIPHGDGRESTPPYLRMAGHFWWSRLPHTEILSRLLHILSEARGCRKAGVDVEHPLWRTTPIDTGVAAFLRNRPGPSIPSSSLPLVPFPSRDDRPVALGVGAPNGASTPLPPTQERNHPLAHTHTPFPHN